MKKLSYNIVLGILILALLWLFDFYSQDVEKIRGIPILDIVYEENAVPSIIWLNEEPIGFVVSSYIGSWFGFPIQAQDNQVTVEALSNVQRFKLPGLYLRRHDGGEIKAICAIGDHCVFNAWDYSQRKFLQIPRDFNELPVIEYTGRLLDAIISGERAAVDLMFSASDGSNALPAWIFNTEKDVTQNNHKSSKLSATRGRYFIMVYPNQDQPDRLDDHGNYLLAVSSANRTFELSCLLFYYNENKELCLYTADSSVLGRREDIVLEINSNQTP